LSHASIASSKVVPICSSAQLPQSLHMIVV
jgi:hypothetical protein